MGCLAERFMAQLIDELPEVDKFYGKFNWKEMLNDLGKSYKESCRAKDTSPLPSITHI